jgi:hypothetical protein
MDGGIDMRLAFKVLPCGFAAGCAARLCLAGN